MNPNNKPRGRQPYSRNENLVMLSISVFVLLFFAAQELFFPNMFGKHPEVAPTPTVTISQQGDEILDRDMASALDLSAYGANQEWYLFAFDYEEKQQYTLVSAGLKNMDPQQLMMPGYSLDTQVRLRLLDREALGIALRKLPTGQKIDIQGITDGVLAELPAQEYALLVAIARESGLTLMEN